ncbi:MAG: hypothetical protein M3410_06335, partial [Acidobacteriota bacterium]|nr:hypothetical protein [Acidobacteriota bacterium]
CDVYCGARETVGESIVSSGCWGEDSDHEYGWARRTPTYVAPIRFFWASLPTFIISNCRLPIADCRLPITSLRKMKLES